jgi:hypothetical protein
MRCIVAVSDAEGTVIDTFDAEVDMTQLAGVPVAVARAAVLDVAQSIRLGIA